MFRVRGLQTSASTAFRDCCAGLKKAAVHSEVPCALWIVMSIPVVCLPNQGCNTIECVNLLAAVQPARIEELQRGVVPGN